jgi:hypothetical protein
VNDLRECSAAVTNAATPMRKMYGNTQRVISTVSSKRSASKPDA